LCAQASDCFSPPAVHSDIQQAFAAALDAAPLCQRPLVAEARVRLAKSSYLVAIHDYSDGIAELEKVVKLTAVSGDQATKAEAFRRLGHAWQELGYYDTALSLLRDAQSVALQHQRKESRLIELLMAENEALTHADRWMMPFALNGAMDLRANSQFAEKIILSHAARRRRDPAACSEFLNQARQYCDGNLAHRLDIEHEGTVTMLHSADLAGADARVTQVLRTAMLAVRYADRLGRPYAQARARCSMAWALLKTGQAEQCINQLSRAEQALQMLADKDAHALTVYLQRIRGEALVALRQYREAVTALELADRQLNQQDSWARGGILIPLGIAHRELGDPLPALAAHATAVGTFRRHNDQVATELAFDELCATMRAAGFGAYRIRRMRRAFAEGTR
jgi:tetratricopeptide (TPR) repeat protein